MEGVGVRGRVNYGQGRSVNPSADRHSTLLYFSIYYSPHLTDNTPDGLRSN